MGFEKLRLLGSALLWLAAGAVAASASSSSRTWVGALVLLAFGFAIAWPLVRPRSLSLALPEPASQPDTQRLATLQSQLEHLPVAAWVQTNAMLQPLTNRARRLAASDGIRDPDALKQLLIASEHNGPVVLDTERGSERWRLQRRSLAIDGQAQTLIVLMPLEHELESESLEAWQQLLRVLTHEIMNSLTPIKSLSETASNLLTEPDSEPQLRTALDAISRRAESLSAFVNNYRRVSQLPAPNPAPVDLVALFKRMEQAVVPAWAARGGGATFEMASPSLRLMADEGQLEQVLLALINNAEHATADQLTPQLWVQARQSRAGRLHISVRDNGPGVPVGMERQIFLPFFSTREDGQGIGLTVVRQLMFGMRGRVRHARSMEGGAMFVLIF
jgi:C4-dicarboxylate-specific signal transduction histidine kinase